MKLAHIHLGDKGGAENFFLRLSKALHHRGVEQIAFIQHNREWHDELASVADVRPVRFSRSHIKRHLIRNRIARQIDQFGANAVLGWMSPAAKWVPKSRADRQNFIRLGDYPDGFLNYDRVDGIIGNTPDIIRQCHEDGWPADKTHIISNFVEEIKSNPTDREEHNTPSDAFLIVGLGRFVTRKRFDLLIQAVARVEGAYLWLVGDGPEADNLKRLTEELGITERVRFIGWVADGAPYIKAADCLCCPSDHEPLGNVVLEGWAAGTAVVATASEGPSWLIKDGINGLLCDLGDAEALRAHFLALRVNSAMRNRLVLAATKKLSEQHTNDIIIKRYLQVLL